MRLKLLGSPVQVLGPRVRPPATTTRAEYLDPAFRELVERERVKRFGDRSKQHCEDPKCKRPERVGCVLYADHIIELNDGGSLMDPDNLMFRCGSCHTLKTNRVRGERHRLREGYGGRKVRA